MEGAMLVVAGAGEVGSGGAVRFAVEVLRETDAGEAATAGGAVAVVAVVLVVLEGTGVADVDVLGAACSFFGGSCTGALVLGLTILIALLTRFWSGAGSN